ncbi:hypothetical protein KVR01_012014 [Diaporthe batatas]|uniref:uncharacterized protein n=1 Tax=Diaporthe batatas TaxID=748121 RepID=UPI001D05953D|nr:uncharacterized protein KVR01_012014 [Diaporthe batatas]KAG8158253.1 hypothetical protein KVR01_012014 [Diaporthe batatas]
MKLLSFLLTLFLVWTAAAAVIQDRASKGSTAAAKPAAAKPAAAKPASGKPATDKTKTDKTKTAAKGKPNEHQALLIEASKKGAPKYQFPPPPAKGKKVSRRSAGADDTTTTHAVQRRAINEAGLNEVKTGTAADEVITRGLGTCVGVIVTYGRVSPGKVDKIVGHFGAFGGQPAITKMGKAIMDAAVEGGLWDPDVDEGHRPQIHVLWPDVAGEIADMGLAPEDIPGMTATLNGVLSSVNGELQKMSTLLRGRISEKTRQGATKTGGTIRATTNGQVTADGVPF